jgi:hypothetical protein
MRSTLIFVKSLSGFSFIDQEADMLYGHFILDWMGILARFMLFAPTGHDFSSLI